MADVQGDDHHGHCIQGHPGGVGKRGRHQLVNGCDGFVRKRKFYQVNDDEQENEEPGIGHGVGADGPAAGIFIHLVAGGAGVSIATGGAGGCPARTSPTTGTSRPASATRTA